MKKAHRKTIGEQDNGLSVEHGMVELLDPIQGCTSEYSRFFNSSHVEQGLIRGIDYRAKQKARQLSGR